MRGCLTLIVTLCVLAYLAADDGLLPETGGGPAPTSSAPEYKGQSSGHLSPTGVFKRTYTWSDINRRRFRLVGDKIMFQSPATEPPFTMTVKLPKARVSQAINAFGVPADSVKYTINYRTQAELAQKKAARDRQLRKRGFVRVDERRIGPDYPWIVERSRGDLKATMRSLQRLAVKREYKTMRDLYGLVATFVQSLKYVIPPETRKLSGGKTVLTTGLNMPQEALVTGEGDCDTVSMLFGGLVANLRTAKTILVVGERGFDHAFVGVRATPRAGDRYIKVQGVAFVLIELTNPFPLGVIPSKNWRYLERNMYRVIPLG